MSSISHGALLWLAVAAAVVVVVAGTLLIRRGVIMGDYRYRHAPGMATHREVLAVAGRKALAHQARYTRPALQHPQRAARESFAAVGARIGTVGKHRQNWFGVGHQETFGVLGPTQQGKTRRLLARLIADSPGTVIFASTKPDLLDHVLPHLQGRRVYCLDPDNVLDGSHPNVISVQWSPVIGGEDPGLAIRRARGFVGDGDDTGTTNSKFFSGSASRVLRCYLHAAALAGLDLSAVVRWADDRTDTTPLEILRAHDPAGADELSNIQTPHAAPGWAQTLRGQLGGQSTSEVDVYKQLSLALDVFADPAVLRRACPTTPAQQFDMEAFLISGHALFVLAAEEDVNCSAYTSAFLAELLWRARRLAILQPAGRWDPPISCTIDELPNIARIPNFVEILRDTGGRGVTIRWAAQSPSDLDAVWGRDGAKSIRDNTRWTVVLQGLQDADYLGNLERLAGTTDELTNKGPNPFGRQVPVLPISSIATQQEGTAVVVHANLRPFRAQLVDIAADKPARATQQLTAAPNYLGQLTPEATTGR